MHVSESALVSRWRLDDALMKGTIRNRRLIQEISKFIEEHLDSNLSVTELAKYTSYSREQFIRIFKQVTGMPPSLYIRYIRVEQAKKWLAGTEMSVTEVAGKVGYENVNSFTRMFQDAVGMSPSMYRNIQEEMTHTDNNKP